MKNKAAVDVQPVVTAVVESGHENTFSRVRETVLTAKTRIYQAVNFAMVEAYWEIGREIVEAQGPGERAEYGKGLIEYLSKALTAEFGNGFSVENLRSMRMFYLTFTIRYTLSTELSWSHYRQLIRIEEPKRREFYMNECVQAQWSTRQLSRQIHSFYYERLLSTQAEMRDEVRNEIQTLEPNLTPQNILKDPYVLEFLGMNPNTNHLESDVEKALITNLQDFLLELGRGFAFVARQKRFTLDGDHFYVDLVFYNYLLKCFVLIDLKVGKLNHQDIGQIDFYRRYFDDQVKKPDDTPTIGIILCSDKNEAMVKYSVMTDNANLFAAKYQLYLPTEQELTAELKRTIAWHEDRES